ncbi:DnaJ like chaperone protein [Aquimarina sp. EL_43]|uniref:TerB family tellurite resistance protein n=1 Tax=unclassified Aquimarina TaxID=2627091 RepID=UPI0018CB12FF|nr:MULTISPECIES: TerB family tellurite resistance protein [unclassified Aquimarina]MBG6132822.1 DnaJ like chaperone protein [Aquimarina sp. EL_35]MBG6153101.1 DnaJ like chaperone protein [Aquimarina sp. EL_32]MBG6171257.1 DnaJ like chaperone protein [Aquimarina sp. EL_43]
MIKWFAAILGYIFFRLPGAVLGFILGSLLDATKIKTSGGFKTVFSQEPKVTPADFELNLLSLSSIVIKADGRVNQTELDYVRRYFVSAYGKERANATFRTFNEIIKNRHVSAQRVCLYINQHTRYPSRLQILHFLFGIANADGRVSISEAEEIQKIAGFLRINFKDFESIKAMFFKTGDHAYKILEIDKTATDAEVKKAFRTMAKKYHPDKVQHMDEIHIKGAETKFREVQKAYDQIKKERGIV